MNRVLRAIDTAKYEIEMRIFLNRFAVSTHPL